MKNCFVKFLTVCALCPLAVHLSRSGDVPEKETLSASLCSAYARTWWQPGVKNPEKTFHVDLKIMKPALWRMVYCNEKDARLAVHDSTGGRFGVLCCEESLFMEDLEHPVLEMECRDWLPAAGAAWVELKGKIPCISGKEEALSEGLSFTVGQKDQKKPLLLKGAVLEEAGSEKDGRGSLEMSFVRDRDSGGLRMEMKLKSSRYMGILRLELTTPEGAPFPAKEDLFSRSSSSGEYSWFWSYLLNPDEKGKVHVAVNYMTGLEWVDMPVEIKFGMSGLVQDSQKGE